MDHYSKSNQLRVVLWSANQVIIISLDSNLGPDEDETNKNQIKNQQQQKLNLSSVWSTKIKYLLKKINKAS